MFDRSCVPISASFLLCVVLSSGLLSGCTTLGPDFKHPDTAAPKQWSDWHSGDQNTSALPVNTQVQPTGQWWKSFDDPVLDQLQQRLESGSPDLRTAMLNFTQARLQSRIVASNRGVDINASGGINRQNLSEYSASMRMAAISSPAGKNALIGALAKPFTLYQAGFDAGWEPDLWGRISRSIESADASGAANAALLKQVRLSLQAELARAYFELRSLQRQRGLLQREIDIGEQRLALAVANRDAGLASDIQVESLKARLSEQRSALPGLASGAGVMQNAITTMLGEHPGVLQKLLAPLAPANDGAAASARAVNLSLGLPSELARRRPDIRAAEAQLHAATAEIGVATADLYPRVTLHAGLGFESFEQGAFGEWASHQWSIGPGFYLPIFNHGRLKARVELTKVAQQRAAVHYHQTVLKAWQEVDNALTAYSAALERDHRLRQKLVSARQQQRLIAANRSAGLTDASGDLEARSQLLSIERQLADSSANLKIQRVAVYKAIGGGVGGASAATR